MDTLEIALMSVLWNVIYDNDTSLKFVHCTCDLKLAADLLESLHTFTDDHRNKFDELEAGIEYERRYPVCTLMSV